jgi:hypothetical protein
MAIQIDPDTERLVVDILTGAQKLQMMRDKEESELLARGTTPVDRPPVPKLHQDGFSWYSKRRRKRKSDSVRGAF